jgi:hypothetical protein
VAVRWRANDRRVRLVTTLLLAVAVAPGRAGAEAEADRSEQTIEPGAARVIFRPTFDGRPVQGLGGARATVSFIGSLPRPLFPPARIWDGYIESEAVPTGVYYAKVIIEVAHEPEASWPLPGDLSGEVERIPLLHDGESVTVELPVARVMRLRDPEDTGRGVARGPDEAPRFRSPVRFAWDGIPEADRYTLDVSIFRPRPDDPRAPSRATTRHLFTQEVPMTHWRTELPPSERGEYYEVALTALGSKGTVGKLFVKGEKWYGFAYRFVVDASPVGEGADTDTALVVPPWFAGSNHPDLAAPLREWCGHAKYPSAAPCEDERKSLASASWTESYQFARCVPVSETGRPTRRQQVEGATRAEFARAVGEHGRVGTAEELGLAVDPPASLVVVRNPEHGVGSPRPVAVIDVAPSDLSWQAADAMARPRARQGLEEYWQIRFAESPGPGSEMVHVWREPAPEGSANTGGFLRSQGIGGSGRLEFTSFPGASIDVGAILTNRCAPPPPPPCVSADEWER